MNSAELSKRICDCLSDGYDDEENREEAEEKVKDGIREGLFDPPENCSDSWCETEEIK